MQIVTVEVERAVIPAAMPPFKWRRGTPGSDPEVIGGILRIGTDAGVEGIATTRRGLILEDLVNRRLRAELVGADPFEREWIWQRVWELDRVEELPIYLLGIVDIALWDLAGKALKVPTYQLLGAYRREIPAYASTTTFASIEEYLEVADQCLELGFKAIKLHAWGDAREDARLAEALRAHVGGSIDLMYDGSAGFDLPMPSISAGPSLARDFAGTKSRCGSSASRHTSGSRIVSKSRFWWRRPQTVLT